MSTPLTPAYEAEIRTREQAATPGPWHTDGWEIYQGAEGDTPDLMKWVGETCRADDYDGSWNDAAFIAHARVDVPALLAEIDRLRAERDEYATQLDGLHLAQWGDEQPETEAHPRRDRWRVEIYDPLAKEWAPGIALLVRERAVERLNTAQIHSPRWADDATPVARRLVRETTTYIVEAGESNV